MMRFCFSFIRMCVVSLKTYIFQVHSGAECFLCHCGWGRGRRSDCSHDVELFTLWNRRPDCSHDVKLFTLWNKRPD